MPTILAVNNDASAIAARLLAAAGDEPDRVRVVTGGKYPGFSVDDELAAAAGFVIDDEPTEYTDPNLTTPVPGAPEIPFTDSGQAAPEPAAEPVQTPAEAVESPAEADSTEEAPLQTVADDAVEEPTVEEPKPVQEKTARRTNRSK